MTWLKCVLEDGAPRTVELGEVVQLRADDGAEFRLGYGVKRGGNGAVFTSRHPTDTSRRVAIKVQTNFRPQRVDRFNNEVRILRTLQGDRLPEYYGQGTFTHDGLTFPWVAMDLCGNNLAVTVQDDGPLPMKLVPQVGIQVCRALEQIHALKIIHRDVKPENLVWKSETLGDVVMIDFGIAKFVGEDVSGRPMDQFTRIGEFVGAHFFASPELIAYGKNQAVDVDQRSDLFQLGKVLWYLATGRVLAGIPQNKHDPFGGPLLDVVSRLIQDDPDDRPQSATEVASLLLPLSMKS